MRRDIEHVGWGKLSYEIRAIVAVAQDLRNLGLEIIWENIGDPIEKGEQVPGWIKDIIAGLAQNDKSYGYCATQGVLESREFVARMVNQIGRAHV